MMRQLGLLPPQGSVRERAMTAAMGLGGPGEATVQAELIARYRILHCQPAFEVTAIARRTSARGDRSRRMSRTTSGGAQRNVQLSRAPPRVPSSLRQVLCACWARYKLHPPGGAVRARDDCERSSTRELPVVCDPPRPRFFVVHRAAPGTRPLVRAARGGALGQSLLRSNRKVDRTRAPDTEQADFLVRSQAR
jgi:hypothetical protein